MIDRGIERIVLLVFIDLAVYSGLDVKVVKKNAGYADFSGEKIAEICLDMQ